MFPLSVWRLGAAMVVLSAGLGIVELVLRMIGFPPAQQSLGSTIALIGVITVWPWRGVRVVRMVLDTKRLVPEGEGHARLRDALAKVQSPNVQNIEVVIFSSDKIRAITLGTKTDSLIAVSTGALAAFNDRDLEALLAHEQGHIEGGHSIQSYAMLSSLFLAKVLFGGFGIPITMVVLLGYLHLLRTNELEADRLAAARVGAANMQRFLLKLASLTNGKAWSETALAEAVSTHPRFKTRDARLAQLVSQKD